jgi:hypothetical protein
VVFDLVYVKPLLQIFFGVAHVLLSYVSLSVELILIIDRLKLFLDGSLRFLEVAQALIVDLIVKELNLDIPATVDRKPTLKQLLTE